MKKFLIAALCMVLLASCKQNQDSKKSPDSPSPSPSRVEDHRSFGEKNVKGFTITADREEAANAVPKDDPRVKGSQDTAGHKVKSDRKESRKGTDREEALRGW